MLFYITKFESISIVHRKTKGKLAILLFTFAFGLICLLNRSSKISMNLIRDSASLGAFCPRGS